MGLKINEAIPAKSTVRVIGPDGDQLGIMLGSQAVMKAQELELDLVEVSPEAKPPVCKIMDYGKYLYQSQKKQKKPLNDGKPKELRMKPRIGEHDLEVKVNHAKKFVEGGHRVMFTVMFKGRELSHKDLGESLIKKVAAMLGDDVSINQEPYWDQRSLKMLVGPGKAKKSKD